MAEKEWFLFVHMDRKYLMGMRTNRPTRSGYWNTTRKYKGIFCGTVWYTVLVGMKKMLVFYHGRATSG